MNCKEICEIIEKSFPLSYAEGYDNVGLLLGREYKEIKSILIALEVTEKVINEAIENNVDMIISHHPLIFKPLKNITDSSYIGSLALKLLEHKICLYASHTNFDSANNGMNDILCKKIGLTNAESLEDIGEYSIGRIGYLKEDMNFKEFCFLLKEKFSIENIIVSGDLDRTIKKVAVLGGSGADYLPLALKKGCDCLVTGDIKHHSALDYSHMGLNIIDLTHFNSEIIFKEGFKEFLEKEVEVNIILSKVETNPLNII